MNSTTQKNIITIIILFFLSVVLSVAGTFFYLTQKSSNVLAHKALHTIPKKSGLTIQLAKEKCLAHIQRDYPIRKSTSIVLQRETAIRGNKAHIFLKVLNGKNYSNFTCVVSSNITVEQMDVSVESRIENNMKSISNSAFGYPN